MTANAQVLIEKLEQLPPQQLAEVENFVDFLANKSRRNAAWQRLLAIAPALEVACDAPPMSMEEINAEIKAVRAEWRDQAQVIGTSSTSRS